MRAKLIKEFINEEKQQNILTDGQNYAVKYMFSLGLNLISNSNQIVKGNLIFEDKYKIKWGIFSTGYLRKLLPNNFKAQTNSWHAIPKWQVIYRELDPQYINKVNIEDEEYKELAEILGRKILEYHKKLEKKIN